LGRLGCFSSARIPSLFFFFGLTPPGLHRGIIYKTFAQAQDRVIGSLQRIGWLAAVTTAATPAQNDQHPSATHTLLLDRLYLQTFTMNDPQVLSLPSCVVLKLVKALCIRVRTKRPTFERLSSPPYSVTATP